MPRKPFAAALIAGALVLPACGGEEERSRGTLKKREIDAVEGDEDQQYIEMVRIGSLPELLGAN